MILSAKGIIKFSPKDKTKKHHSQSSWKKVAMILTNDDMCEYYNWFILKRFNLVLNKPLRGSHITFINDRDIDMPLFNDIVKKYNGKEVKFYIDTEPKTNGKHWWLRVFCADAEFIRIEGGGKPIPNFNFHLTLGHANEKNIEHSKYILRMCKMFNLIDYTPRKEFNKLDNIKEILNNE